MSFVDHWARGPLPSLNAKAIVLLLSDHETREVDLRFLARTQHKTGVLRYSETRWNGLGRHSETLPYCPHRPDAELRLTIPLHETRVVIEHPPLALSGLLN